MKYGCGEIEVRGSRFRVRAYLDGKRTPLGTYPTEAEAKSVTLTSRRACSTKPALR